MNINFTQEEMKWFITTTIEMIQADLRSDIELKDGFQNQIIKFLAIKTGVEPHYE